MKSINLVQRCKVKEEKYTPKAKVSDFIKLDYMGSTEFELGGFAKGIRYIQENQKDYQMLKVTNEKGSMWVFAKEEQKNQIEQFISAHMTKDYSANFSTKEYTNIAAQFEKNIEKTHDFWMDIENFFVFSLEKKHLDKFIQASENSIQHMDKVKNELDLCNNFIKEHDAHNKLRNLGFHGILCPTSIYDLSSKSPSWNDFSKKTKYNFSFWLNSWDKKVTESRHISAELLLEWLKNEKITNDNRLFPNK